MDSRSNLPRYDATESINHDFEFVHAGRGSDRAEAFNDRIVVIIRRSADGHIVSARQVDRDTGLGRKTHRIVVDGQFIASDIEYSHQRIEERRVDVWTGGYLNAIPSVQIEVHHVDVKTLNNQVWIVTNLTVRHKHVRSTCQTGGDGSTNCVVTNRLNCQVGRLHVLSVLKNTCDRRCHGFRRLIISNRNCRVTTLH